MNTAARVAPVGPGARLIDLAATDAVCSMVSRVLVASNIEH